MNKVSFDAATIEARDRYKLLSGLVVPRPIGWIGTRRRSGTNNLAPFSFFNLVATTPPTVLFSAGRHSDRPKDSVTLAEESGVFTVNIVSERLAAAMSVTAGSYGSEDDEFEIAGLTAVNGTLVDAPLVGEAPANLECRVRDVVTLGDEGKSRMVIGEVVMIHVRPDVLDGTRINQDSLAAIGRMAGNTYLRSHDRFEIARPA